MSQHSRAAADAAVDATAGSFIDALIIAFQSEAGRAGYASDLRWAAGLCRATWGEEQIWAGLVHVRCGRKKRTHLMYAADMEDTARIRWLLARGATTELRDADGMTALHHILFSNEAACALIEAGADVNARTKLGITPVYFSSLFGAVDVLQTLIAAGADVNLSINTGQTPVYGAIMYNKVDALRILVANGAAVNTVDTLGQSPLYTASAHGHVDALRVLIAAGADVNTSTRFSRQTPVYVACEKDDPNSLRILIAAGADVNFAARDGSTPLSTARAISPTSEVVHLLVAAGAR